MVSFNSFHQFFSGSVDFWFFNAESFSVGCPENDNLIKVMLGFKISDVLSDLVKVLHLVLSWENIIGPVFLVGSNEIRIIDGRERNKAFHVRRKFLLEIIFKHLGSPHSIS